MASLLKRTSCSKLGSTLIFCPPKNRLHSLLPAMAAKQFNDNSGADMQLSYNIASCTNGGFEDVQ